MSRWSLHFSFALLPEIEALVKPVQLRHQNRKVCLSGFVTRVWAHLRGSEGEEIKEFHLQPFELRICPQPSTGDIG
jgi:hypothetical protein